MKWKRYGKIFSPQEYGLEYAKSPQAVVFEEFIRIYFSACKKDGDKLISYVCFADFSKDFKKTIRVLKQILPDGNLGCFDEHGIFPFSPMEYEGRIYGYTSGWSRRRSVSVDTGIGLAVSDDGGESFVRVGEGPVLTSSLDEPFLVVDGFVRRFQGQFHMWYIYGQSWRVFEEGAEPDRIYKIGHAVSNDGLVWKKEGRRLIPDRLLDESQALPCVVFYQNKYHMFFCYRSSYDFRTNRERSYRIGYAVSEDLKTWDRRDEELNFTAPETGWDGQMNCYPNAFVTKGELYMLYNGNQFGKYGFGMAKLEGF